MIASPVKIVWFVAEPTEALSRDYIWRKAVRSRRSEELTFLLNVMELDGVCDIIVAGADGWESLFRWRLDAGRPAGAGVASEGEAREKSPLPAFAHS